jgi:hypothetical protein
MKRGSSYLVLLLCLVMISCGRSEEILPADALTSDGCSAPCWQGLTPGQSTLEDVEALLRRTDPLTILVSEYPAGNECKNWKVGVQLNNGGFDNRTIHVEGGEVKFIESSSTLDLSLQQVVSRFGSPEYAQAVVAKGPDGQLYILEVYYPAKGLAFVLEPNQRDVGQIRSNTPVARIQYFPPGDLLSYLATKQSCSRGIAEAKLWAANELRLVGRSARHLP